MTGTSGGGSWARRLAVRARAFTDAQSEQLHAGGIRVLLRKAVKAVLLLLTAPFALLLVAGMWLLRPLVLVRLAPLRSERIGMFAACTEIYLTEKDQGLHASGFDLFYLGGAVSNGRLLRMWRREVPVVPRSLSAVPRVATAVSMWIPGGRAHVSPLYSNEGWDVHGLLAKTEPHLRFTHAEEQEGDTGLRALGIPEGSEFVCFHVRDSAYLEKELPGRDWTEHSYRDAPLASHFQAIEDAVRRGLYVVRLGSVAAEPLPDFGPKVIDYPNSGLRTELLDIYLGAKCRFYFGSDSGIYGLPAVFRRPIVFLNFPVIERLHVWGWNYLHVPALMRSKSNGGLLGFREILSGGIGHLTTSQELDEAGVELVYNTSEDVLDAFAEMDDRLRGTWVESDEDARLQARFWEIVGPTFLNDPPRPLLTRVSSRFLRRHEELLD